MNLINFKKVRSHFKCLFEKSSIPGVEFDEIASRVLNINRLDLFSAITISRKQFKSILKCAKKRLKHVPISSIFNYSYFYGRKFFVNNNVLTPRFDTEIVVNKAFDYIHYNSKVLDIFSGSGCIGITINLETKASVVCSDISKKSCKVIRKNAKQLSANVNVVCSNLFEKIVGKFDVIVANPPYIESNEISSLEPEVKYYDPILALDGGKDGLNFYRILAQNIKNYLYPSGVLVMEIGYNQAECVKKIFNDVFNSVECYCDLDKLPRVIICKNLKGD